MSKRSVLSACIVAILGFVSIPAALPETVIAPSQSCRTDIQNLDTNHHDSSKLSIRSDEKSAKSWVKFDLGDLDVSALEVATLTVALHEGKSGDRNFDVSYVNDDCLDNIDWDERTLTWNNAPGNSTTDLGGLDASRTTLVATVYFTDGVPGDAFAIDILDALETDTDGIVQFVFHNSNGLLNLATHDHATEAWRPFITVTEGSKAKAKKPYPAKGATDVPYDVNLTWTPGAYAPAVNGHNVYFSDSLDDVNDGVALVSPGQDANSYDPGRLEFGVTYYWRVDEANSVTGWEAGDIWSFTTEPVAYPITDVDVTASIPPMVGMEQGPERTVDGSGLIDGQHSTEEADMWLGDAAAGGPVWLRYDFDRVYKLHEVHIWNHNNAYEALIGLGAKSVTIEYAADADNWAVLGDFEIARAPGLDTYAGMTIDLGGIVARSVRINVNSNWGGQTRYGLAEVRFSYIPVVAREPNPGLGVTDVPLETTLSWRSGREAAAHQVHFGTDSGAVADGTALTDALATPSYSVGGLSLGTTYYWKIDEVNEATDPSVWEGPVWSFTTTDYLVVEDFEAYTDEAGEEVFATWADGYGDNFAGNGAQVGYDMPSYTEHTVRHGGAQSMPLHYGKGSQSHSEASRTFAPAQDWTKAGAGTLTLYVCGLVDNEAGQLSVKVNGAAKAVEVDFAAESWQEVNVDLSSLGVDLQSVTSLAISIDGAVSGMVLVDDIRLRP